MRQNISIIVPTYNQRESLRALIIALQKQSYQNFELVLVDNGPDRRNFEHVNQVLKDLSYTAKVIQTTKNIGPGGGRNLGVKHAQYPILAFTDDDCIPDMNWVESISNAFDKKDVEIIFGKVYSAIPSNRPYIHAFDLSGKVFGSGNCAISKDLFIKVGGFDTFLNTWAEDFEFGKRLEIQGNNPVYIESMLIDHPPKLQPYKFRNSTLNFSVLDKYHYITKEKKMEFTHNLTKTSIKKGMQKIIILLLFLLLPLEINPLFKILIGIALFVLLYFRRVIGFKAISKSYPFTDKISNVNYLYYNFTMWFADIYSLMVVLTHTISRQLLRQPIKRD